MRGVMWRLSKDCWGLVLQKWLKDNLQRSKGPAGSGLKEKTPGRRESFWGSAKKSPSVASKAHKSLIDRFNNPS